MGSVSDIRIDEKVDDAINQLDEEKSFGIALAEFSRTIVDRPENHRKIANSFSGHAVHLQNTVILREMRLWCCRIWEKNGHSLPFVSAKFIALSQKIIAARRLAHPDWPEHLLQVSMLGGRIEAFAERVEQVGRSPVLIELRVTRDEHFAHLLAGVSATRKKNPVPIEREGYTYNEVLLLVDESVALIAEAIFIWRFHTHSDENSRKILRRYYERYWELLPVFSELEETQRNERIAEAGDS